MTIYRSALVACTLAAAPAFAQTPAVVNGTVETRAITQPAKPNTLKVVKTI